MNYAQRVALGGILAVLSIAIAMFLISSPPITGDVIATKTVASVFVVGNTFEYNCNVSMVEGWNLISLPCTLGNMSVSLLFENETNNYHSIHTFDPLDQSDPWKVHNPHLPNYTIQDLSEIEIELGYWIKAENNLSLNVSGTITAHHPVILTTGWNLVGYPSNKTETPEESFVLINSSIGSVHAYNASDPADFWKVWAPTLLGFNDLVHITPYWGYWINATGGTIWFTPVQ